MRLEGLRLIHQRKGGVLASPAGMVALDSDEVFHVDSCQRRLWAWNGKLQGTLSPDKVDSSTELLQGHEAYHLLLRVAAGLESRIVGETDIFGQIKEAWKKSPLAASARSELDPWMQRL